VTLQVHDIHLLKGERPGNLPVHQATAFEIIVNQKAADKAERASFGQRPAFFGQPFMWICALDNIGGA
jgi:hypothetical protein